MTPAQERFRALCKSLLASGLMGESPCPLSGIDFVEPSSAIGFWRDGIDPTVAQAVIDGWDWTPLEEPERVISSTLEAIRTADDPVSRGTRATITLLFTWLNDLREKTGLPRYSENEIMAAIATSTQEGAGEPR